MLIPPAPQLPAPSPPRASTGASPAGSEPAPRLCRPGIINLRSSMPKPCGFSTPRTRMPCGAYVDTPSRGVTLGAFICGSFFAEASEIKISILKRTRMTQIKRIFADFPIRANPRHPRKPCSTSASLFADAPYSKDSDRINRMDRINPSTNPVNPVHPVQSGSSFSAAPDINCSEFINGWTSQNSSPQSHHIFIHNTFIGLAITLYTDRMKSSYARGNAYKNPEGKIWYPV